jgi:molybdopterin converting factor small subunit
MRIEVVYLQQMPKELGAKAESEVFELEENAGVLELMSAIRAKYAPRSHGVLPRLDGGVENCSGVAISLQRSGVPGSRRIQHTVAAEVKLTDGDRILLYHPMAGG